MPTADSDNFTRPRRAQRLSVTVEHGLSQPQLERAVVHYVTAYEPGIDLELLPATERLCRMVWHVLWEDGSGLLTTAKNDPDPESPVAQYARRAAARLWTSRKIMVAD
jgi:hypothetical protein